MFDLQEELKKLPAKPGVYLTKKMLLFMWAKRLV